MKNKIPLPTLAKIRLLCNHMEIPFDENDEPETTLVDLLVVLTSRQSNLYTCCSLLIEHNEQLKKQLKDISTRLAQLEKSNVIPISSTS